MYEYKIVKVKLSGVIHEPNLDYHKIIHDHAEDGWKLHSIFSPNLIRGGIAHYFELIFERWYD